MTFGPRHAAAAVAFVAWSGLAWAQNPHAGHAMPVPAAAPAPSQGTRVDPGPLSPATPPSAAFTGDHEPLYGAVLVDQLEYRGSRGAAIAAFEAQAYYGGDYNKVWFNTRGEYSGNESAFERAELQVLYSRLIGYFFNAQAGVRQDLPIRPNEGTPARTHLVLGIQGLLPNLFEANLQFYVNQRGTVSARLEGSYDAYLTQRLVLQPQIELNVAANSDRRSRLGSGLTSLETGLRLRYEVTREFAPYIGLSYERAFGETANIARRNDEKPETLTGVAGIRLFF